MNDSNDIYEKENSFSEEVSLPAEKLAISAYFHHYLEQDEPWKLMIHCSEAQVQWQLKPLTQCVASNDT